MSTSSDVDVGGKRSNYNYSNVQRSSPDIAVERRHAGRHRPRPARLLEGVGEAQQCGLAPGAAGKGGTERIVRRLLVVEAGNKPGRHLDARIAGFGRDRRAGPA